MSEDRYISLAHGNGGRYMRELIAEVFARHLSDPGKDNTLYPLLLQAGSKRCRSEAVGKVLGHNMLVGQRRDGAVDVHADGVRQKEGGTRLRGYMLYVVHASTRPARCGQQLPCLRSGFVGPRKLHRSAGKVVVLDVDQHERSFHIISLCKLSAALAQNI
jgi:hypothetical protein